MISSGSVDPKNEITGTEIKSKPGLSIPINVTILIP